MCLRYLSITIMILFSLSVAQENPPRTDDVQIEVLTTSLDKSSKAQILQVEITCNNSLPGQKLNLTLNAVSGIYVPVSAERNDEALWLIKSEEANDNEEILSWQTIDNTQLQLSPGNWATPYRLDLQIQISLTNLKDMANVTTTDVELILTGSGEEQLATPTGRGNQISLNNSRE
jgi:hypothetical protein